MVELIVPCEHDFRGPHYVPDEQRACDGGTKAEVSDLVEALQVEGVKVGYCQAHQSLGITPGYRCDHYRHLRSTGNEGSPCLMVSALVVPLGEDA